MITIIKPLVIIIILIIHMLSSIVYINAIIITTCVQKAPINAAGACTFVWEMLDRNASAKI